jgi:hypothetical protein
VLSGPQESVMGPLLFTEQLYNYPNVILLCIANYKCGVFFSQICNSKEFPIVGIF